MPLTKANVFNANVLLGDGVGSTGAPGSYFGFGQTGSSAASVGPRIQSGTGDPNGVVTSPIGSQWTDSATGILYINQDGGTTWAVVAGPGSAGGDWFPLTQQSPLNAKTDYFPGSTLNAKWTLWNPGANTTATVSSTQRLQLTQTTHAGNAVGGIRQSAPAATRYAITSFVGVRGIVNNIMDGGIFVAADIAGAPTTAAFLTVDNTNNSAVAGGAMSVSLFRWTNYTTLAGASYDVVNGIGAFLIRLFVDTVGANYMVLVSPNGYSWRKIAVLAFASAPFAGNPQYIGQHVNNANTGESVVLSSAMFRVDDTTDPYLPCGAFGN